MSNERIQHLLDEPTVGPLLRDYLRGFVTATRARRALLGSTIAHVEALDVIERLDAGDASQFIDKAPGLSVVATPEAESRVAESERTEGP